MGAAEKGQPGALKLYILNCKMNGISIALKAMYVKKVTS